MWTDKVRARSCRIRSSHKRLEAILLLEYNHSMFVDDDEPSRFIKFIEGTISELDANDAGEVIGEFSIIVVDVETAVNESSSVFDVFDASSKTIDYFALYDGDLEFKPAVLRALKEDGRWYPNLLILDRLEILPSHRGEGRGLRVIRALRLNFSAGCGAVVMKPFPLQFEGGTPTENRDKVEFKRWRLADFIDDEKVALSRLQAYYRRAGFRKVAGMPFMVANPQLPVPSVDEMGVKKRG